MLAGLLYQEKEAMLFLALAVRLTAGFHQLVHLQIIQVLVPVFAALNSYWEKACLIISF